VPSTGNFAPELYVKLYEAAVKGDEETASKYQEQTNALSRIYQQGRILSESLAGLKVIMNELGLCGEAVLPPFTALSAEEKAAIRKQLAEAGLKK
jgi:4-hydroxy-tetrahydrodipicolinate synthase